ncbi:MAG TPA: SH3 domain-containing protein, partial [Polyangia bacterium]
MGDPTMTCWSPLRALIFLLAVAALSLLLAAPRAHADEEALVRVLAEQAAVHTGPGFGFRVVYTATRGEVLPAIGRSTQDHWFRVQLPDGTYGWLLGDEVLVLEVDTAETHRGPSLWKRMSDSVFSPSPLSDGHVGLTFSAGALGGDGLFLFRPAVVLAPPLTLEAFFGESVGNQVDVIYYGGGFNAFLWPASPVTPFVAAA